MHRRRPSVHSFGNEIVIILFEQLMYCEAVIICISPILQLSFDFFESKTF